MENTELINDIIYRFELQDALDGALEKKLPARRTIASQLQQGSQQKYKTNPSRHVQEAKLEKTKMEDLLKSKITHRPERTELVHRHILEDVRANVDPSLYNRQCQLKRAKLADSLASQLSQRPGPLELIQKNILQTDDPMGKAVKDGVIQFKQTADGVPSKLLLITFEEEDSSGLVLSPPLSTVPSSPLMKDPYNMPDLQLTKAKPRMKSVNSESIGEITIHMAKNTHIDIGQFTKDDGSDGLGVYSQKEEAGRERKKLKAKSIAKPITLVKPRTMKFHEYKGPQTSLKRKQRDNRSAEQSAYDLLLEQQQLFLQWQLENKSKFPQILLPAPRKEDSPGRGSIISFSTSCTSGYISGASSSQASSILNSPSSSIPGTPRSTTPRSSTPTRAMILSPQDVNNATSLLNKLDGMKVNDLKSELRKRSSPVSGSKPVLLERLKAILGAIIESGRKQFKEPYKQISISHGGLIILKPSPNSKLLANVDPDNELTNHEYMPDIDENSMLHSVFTFTHQNTANSKTSSESTMPLSPTGSHSQSVQEKYQINDIFRKRRDSVHSNTELEVDFNFMEIEQSLCMQPVEDVVITANKKYSTKDDQIPPSQLSTFPTSTYVNSPNQVMPCQSSLQSNLKAKAQQPKSIHKSPESVFTSKVYSDSISLQPNILTATSYKQSANEIILRSQPVNQLANRICLQSSIAAPHSNYIQQLVQLPLQPVPISELGLTLKSELNCYKKESRIKENTLLEVEMNATNSNQEDKIKQQQLQIAELHKALEQSEMKLRTQQNVSKISGSNLKQDIELAKQRNQQRTQNIAHEKQVTAVSTIHCCQQGKEGESSNALIKFINKKHSKSIDDVLGIFTKEPDKDVYEIPKTSKPPSPPPLPLQTSKIQFPQLDFTDMFEFFQMSNLPQMPPNQETRNAVEDPYKNQADPFDQMDIDKDMDVQDWLDSLDVHYS